MKLLRRKILMREYDYNKRLDQSNALYHRVMFEPVTADDLEKLHLIHILKHGSVKKSYFSRDEAAKLLLWKVKDYLFTDKYISWVLPEYEDGFIWTQARKSTPKTRLGWAIYEMDY